MDGSALRKARNRAGLSQRGLAARTGVAQPTIARIERGLVDPLVGTLTRLLAACGEELEARPQLGAGIDRTGIRELVRLTPAERIAGLVEEASAAERIAQARRRG
ncbi:MAG TPA: helix-turn-helix domain-containing protein [Acidimicrobiales bacterium]|nr:helix-turn-helix domain-containing protein [Acidimicrobiales bacterium]